MLSARSSCVISWVLSLVTLVHASCDTRNQVSSWENTTFIDAGFKSPSAPFRCQHLWNSTEIEPLVSVRGHFGITRFDLEAWNCFLSSADGPSTPHIAYCVDAVLNPTDVPPPPPPFTQPVQTLVPVESQSAITLYPRQEEVPSIPEHENTTVQSTPSHSLTALYGTTFNNTDFDHYTQNSPSTSGPGHSTGYDFDTWSTVTILQDVEPSAVGLGLGEDETLQIGNIMRVQNDSDIAPKLPHFDGKNLGYGLPCDTPETMETNGTPETCHMTRYCTEKDMLPVCDRGNCRCQPRFCSKTSECEDRDLCRPMDQKPVCDIGSPTSQASGKEGTCACEPKYRDCSGRGGGEREHLFCAEKFNCTAWNFDVFRLPLCQVPNAESPWNSSWCECKETECNYGNWEDEALHEDDPYGGDSSVCAGLPCPSDSDLYGDEPACAWDPLSSTNGTCRCKFTRDD